MSQPEMSEKINLINKVPKDWLAALGEANVDALLRPVEAFLEKQFENKKIVFPAIENIFRAFQITSFDNTRVVILGQDPYHDVDQAHGLSFSVPPQIKKLPPSLKNIFKELHEDLSLDEDPSTTLVQGDLSIWAEQGVLLLNTVLTVEAHQAGSHQGQGWESFTDLVLKTISEKRQGVVFILWGSQAQKKKELLDSRCHLILEAPHPSPLSSYRGFFGSKPFSKCNQYFNSTDQKEIKWHLVAPLIASKSDKIKSS